MQRLIDERGHHAPILQLHARAVGVEDPRDGSPDAVHAMVCHGQRLGVPLAFVVAGAHAHRIHVAPISLHLRMHQRIAVALRCRGNHEARLVFPRDLQHIARARRAHVQRLDGMLEIILGTGQRCQVKHAVHRAFRLKRPAHIPFPKLKRRIALQVLEIASISGHEVVVASHLMPLGNQTVTQVRADETGGPGHDKTQAIPPNSTIVT